MDTPFRPSVLVVDDNKDAAVSTATLLAMHGYPCKSVGCGVDALLMAAAEAPDVVILDIGMPRMDGWELALQLRERATGKQPLLIAVTGFDGPKAEQRSAAVGIDLHLAKPVEPAVLVGVLRRFTEAVAPCAAG